MVDEVDGNIVDLSLIKGKVNDKEEELKLKNLKLEVSFLDGEKKEYVCSFVGSPAENPYILNLMLLDGPDDDEGQLVAMLNFERVKWIDVIEEVPFEI